MAVAAKKQERWESGIRQKFARRRRGFNMLPLLFITVILGLGGLIGYIGIYAKITQDGYRRAKLMAELKAAKTENEYLHAEQRMLSNPDRLAEIATQAGMVASKDVEFLRVPTSVKVARADDYR